ncbi:Sec-independent periplasmic protein translocase [Thermodesulfobium narugense DSM 14796]|uniref:Sec-independent protein translocase protein TatC n=1 Tax=Thermodesulfobium narugense DSM 14796 TaxID=747365 RepID=M1E5X5_9BACT|nr:twin-arginine translocase subunit TatC [Thermodesulfobium narugense]AEE13883.1 Sec-independent periplasmic protein translocase [Thermodesulfobium narugense DSM 14796]
MLNNLDLDIEKLHRSFWILLRRFRNLLFISAFLIGIGAVITYFFIPYFMEYISKPVGKLIFLTPIEAFMTQMKLCLMGGIYLAWPYIIFYFSKNFILPTKIISKKTMWIGITFAVLLFYSGSLFALFVIFPVGIKFLLSFGAPEIEPLFSIGKYVTFVSMFVFVFGLLFEMPIVLLALVRLGIINSKQLASQRKRAILGFFILAMLVSPSTDVFTQCTMAIPLVALYEISIWIARLWKK